MESLVINIMESLVGREVAVCDVTCHQVINIMESLVGREVAVCNVICHQGGGVHARGRATRGTRP